MKKLYISADIEGTCGIVDWQETETGNAYSDYFRRQMTAEVAAACRGALRAGFDEILIKDAHDSARNLYPDQLPRGVRIIRSWSRDPYSMMTGINSSFDAVIFTGYHNAAGTGSNPLSHTMTGNIYSITMNGVTASEFLINSYSAEYHGVPVAMVTGDSGLCTAAKGLVKGIATVPVNEGRGNSSTSLHPADACELIEENAYKALSGDLKDCHIALPEELEVVISFKRHASAYRASFYPGAYLINDSTVGFRCKDYLDYLKFQLFAW
ncbi:MAG: M55 family metallopeptidase [Clostridia bacterium]|nr:M55 family metallopeptidase [Clostridia bacterium]